MNKKKMSMKTRRRLRRALAVVLSIALVTGLGLSYSPDRILRAEELSTEEMQATSAKSTADETPAPSPAKEEAPAPEPAPESVTVQEEPAQTDGGESSGGGEEPAPAGEQAGDESNTVSDQEIVIDAEEEKPEEEAEETEKADETWTVTFYNRDAEVHKTVKVVKGESIGSDMPAVISREDYSAYWALGDIVQGGQGSEIRVTGRRITGSYRPSADTVVVPDYEAVSHTITFYDGKDGNVIEGGVKTVGPDTSYCLNDIPAVPVKDGFHGKWVYDGGDFSNSVAASGDMAVWAEYDKTVFTVTFNVDGKTYQTDTYYSGDKLKLPSEPASEGREFAGWFADGTEYKGGEAVNSDMSITAEFSDKFRVDFVVNNDEGEAETLSQYFKAGGEVIGVMPEDPFAAGKIFEKWVDKSTGEEVTAETVVDRNITAEAQFREVGIYSIKAEYYYVNDSGREVIFSTDLLQAEAHDLPYTITAPATIQTDPGQVSGAPVYYPETPSVTLNKDDFSGNSATVRIKYVKYTATYDVVYLLKDLSGDGYTEIERVSGVQGVLNSYVTPTVKAYDHYALELAEAAKITQEEGQELRVLYTRRNVQLSFETNGGSYVSAVTAPYGSSVALPETNPEREGYRFDGWYSDAALTQKVTGSVTLNGNTTLYAGWKGDTVHYTIVYMFEKYNDTGTSASYVYDNSRSATAAAGSTVKASDAPSITRAGWEKDTTRNASSSVTVAADGSSVLQVYYRLKEYTFSFNAGSYSSYSINADLTGKGVSGTGTLGYTMKVKLGQDISGEWPGNVTGTYTSGGWWSSKTYEVDFNGWKPSGSNTRYVTKRTTVTEDMLPSSGSSMTYTAQWTTNAKTYTANYWLQNADDDGYTKSEVYSQTYTSSSGNLSAKDISGYTYDHGNSGAQGVTEYNFYYNRDKYRIDYYHGSDLLNTIDSVKFDANIDSKKFSWTPTAAQCDVDSDFTFVGWYDNATCQGEPYDFTKMPASNLVLYAKWNAPAYTVSFVNADDSTQASDSQTVEKYRKAEKPANPVRPGWSFDGWYASAEGNDLFDWNTQITSDTTVYARWVRKNLSYIVHYVDEEGNPVASDKEVTNPNLVAGQTITEMAIAVAGYRPNDVSLSFTLGEEENSVTFTYSEKADSTGYTVRYVINSSEFGGNIAVAPEKKVDDVPGDTSSVIELAAGVDYGALYAAHPELEGIEFHPDESEKTLVLTSDEAQNVLTFTYSSFKHADVKLHFVDMEGNHIAGDDLQRLKVGRTFTLGRTPVEGWELSKAVEGTSYGDAAAGTEYRITDSVCDSGLEFTLFYRKKATVTALSASKQYDGTALKLPEEQVRVEGLLSGHSLRSVDFTYANADDGDGRLLAGTATVTPKDAVIDGPSADDYYSVRYISGTLEVTKINVTIRVEPDRWTGARYTGEVYKAGFTNPAKDIDDYIIISSKEYRDAYLKAIWNTIKAKTSHDESAAGLGYYGAAETDAGDYDYGIDVTLADLPEDDNYSVGLYVRPGRLHILPKEISVSTGSAAKEYDGTPLTNEEASITGLVKADEGKVTAKGTGSQTEVGSSANDCSIDWGGVKESNYSIISETTGTLTVTSRAVVLTAGSGSKTYDGKPLTNAGVTASGLPEGFTLEASASGSQTDAGTSVNKVNDGWKIKDASGADVTDRFKVSETVDGTLTVNKAAVTISTGSGSKTYDGKALTNADAEITGLVNGETASVTATGSQTEIGSSGNTCSVKWGTAKASNYTVTENLGTLTVTDSDAEVVLTAESASKTYDGEPLTAPGVTASGLPEGFTLEASASGTQTDAGSSANKVDDGYVIRNAAGEDRTANFKGIQTVDGTLTVNPKPVTVSTGSGSKAYDGEALTNSEAKIEGLVGEETAAVTATGSRTEVGSGSNTCSIEWGTAKAGNYAVTENLGTLTVTENSSAVVLQAASGEKVYDGKALSDSRVTASGLPEGFSVKAAATGSQTDAGTSLNVVNDSYVIMNAAGADRTANFSNVTKADGTLTVTKAELTVTTGSGTKVYDGKALTNDTAELTGLAEGETATVKATGSQTEVGSGDNTYSIDWRTAKAANYNVNEQLGTLTVTENNAEIILTAGSGSKTYDGTALTNEAVTAEGLPEGFTADAAADGSITDAGTAVNAVAEGFAIRNKAGEDRTSSFTNVRTVSGTLTVEPKAVTITTASAEKAYDGTALTAPVAGIEGLVSGETAAVRAIGSVTDPGSDQNRYDITWESAKAANYTVTEQLGTLTVTANDAEVTLTAPSAGKTYDGTELTADGSGDSKVTAAGLPEGFTVEASASGSRTDAGESANVVNDGYVIRNADGEDKTACFTNVKKADGTLTVFRRALTVATGSDSKAYDGAALTNRDASIEGLADGETVGIETTGSITEVGSAENTYSMTWAGEGNDFTAKESNYEVTDNLGTLTVTDSSVDVVLTAASGSKTYDGTALTAPEVSASGLPEGFTVEATASGSQTDAGTSVNVVNDGYVIKNAAGEDRTANFKKVEKVDGTLTVNPKPVTISTGSDSKAYDGTALTNAEARIEGLAAGETCGLRATGSVTDVGSAENSYDITWAGKGSSYTARKSNYTVTEAIGTLTVTANASPVVLTAASGSKEYDGKALTVSEVTAEGLPEGFTVEARTSGSQTDAGSSANKVRSGYEIRNAEGENRTSSFTNMSTVDGTLTVSPRKITISTGSAGKEYDGKALSSAEASVKGLAAGEVVTIVTKGSQTEVGSSPNTYELTWVHSARSANYVIEDDLGTLTVKPNTSEITLTAASAKKTYDGTELSDSSVSAEGLPSGFTVTASASGSQTDAGTGTNTVNEGYVIKNSAGENRTSSFANVKTADGTLTVEKRSVTLESPSDEKVYDGTALINNNINEGGDGFAAGEGAVYSVTGAQKDAGSSSNAFTYTLSAGTNADNYKITKNEGTLTVKPVSGKVTVTVTEHSGSAKYDGTAKTVSGYDVSIDNALYPENGFSFSGNASVSGTDAGSYPMEISPDDFTNNNENFSDVEFVINDGTLEIAKRNVILSSASSEAVYSGAALINHLISVLGDGFADGEGASYEVSGLQKLAGASANAFKYALNDGTKADNYNISTIFGTLTVFNMPADAKYEVTVTAASGEAKYDGSEHSVSGFADGTKSGGSIAVSAGGHSFSVSGLSAEVTAVNAGTYDVCITGTPKVTDEDGSDVTDQFIVRTVPGKLSIAKRSVTMTSANASREYNGKALTKKDVDVTGDGFARGEGAEYTVTGSRVLAGISDNTFSYTLNEGTDASNYDIKTVFGQLTVTSRDAKYAITLVPESLTEKYDGTDKTVSGLKELSFNVDGNAYTVSGVEASRTERNAGTYPVNVTGTPAVFDDKGYDVTDQFEVTSVPGTLTIEKRSVVMTSADDVKAYDGRPLSNDTVTVTGDGFAEGEGASYSVTGSRTLPGTAPNSFSYTLNSGTDAGNYDISTSFGNLTVTNRDAKYEITVKAADAEYLYDGEEKSTEGFDTLEFVADGNTYTVEGLTAAVAATDAGVYTSAISGTPVVKDAKGNDVSAQFAVTPVSGRLVIKPRSVTLTSGSASREYNGRALVKKDVDVTGDGFIRGEGADFNVTGRQTIAGMSDNTFTYSLKDGTKASNYEIKTVFGQLTVINRDAKYAITLIPSSLTEKYDGTEKSVSGFETLSFNVDGNAYTVSGVSAGRTEKNAGSYEINVTGTPAVRDAAGSNVTDQFEVTSVPGTLTIDKRSVVMTSADDVKAYDGRPLRNDTVTVTGDGFAEGEGASYSVTGSRLLPGTDPNRFTYTLNSGTDAGNYDISTSFGNLTVTNRDAKYEIAVKASDAEYLYDGTEKTAEGFETLKFNVDGNSYTVEGLTAAVTQKDAGEYNSVISGTPVVKDAEGNDVSTQFAVIPETGRLVIKPRSVTLTSGSASREYNGRALTNTDVTVSGDGFAEGENAECDVTGRQTIVGMSENSFSYSLSDGMKASNYIIKTVFGQLTVTNRDAKYAITLRPESLTEKYDGTDKTVSGFETLSFDIDGSTYTVSGVEAGRTERNAGTYAVRVTGTPVVRDAAGSNVTDQFEVTSAPSSLVIEKRSVKMESASDVKVYDGNALTNETVTVSGDGFAEGEGASFSVTGSRTLPGTAPNSFTYALGSGTDAGNYDISTSFGTLTVTNRDAKYEITVKAADAEYLYDGSEKSAEGFETLEFSAGGNSYTVEGLKAGVSATDAGEYTSVISGTPVVKDAKGNDVSGQFAVTPVSGRLVIKPRSVTLTSGSASREYNGRALTNSDVTVSGDGFAEGENAEYNVTGRQMIAGMSDNTFSYSLAEGTKESNYIIKTVFGQLTVTNRDAKYAITLRPNSLTEKYDGTEKSVSGFETLSFNIDGNAYSVSGVEAVRTEKNAGTYAVNVSGTPVVRDAAGSNVTDQFEVTSIPGTLTIEKRNVTMTSASDVKAYDGKLLRNDSVTVTGDGFAEGEGATYNVTGSRLLPGSDANSFTYTLSGGTDAGNYDISTSFGTLTVTNRDAKYEISAKAVNAEYLYDGTEKSAEGFETLTFSVDGNSYTLEGLTASASAKNAGTYTSVISGTPVVKDADGNDVSAQFAVTPVSGRLVIRPRTITMTSASASQVYNGRALTGKDIAVTGDGFAEGEGAEYDVTGRQMIAGMSDNTFSYILSGGTDAANYVIKTIFGQLTVTARDAKYSITLRPQSLTDKYDGTEKSVSGFETLSFDVDGSTYTVSGVKAERTEKNAGTYQINVKGTPVVLDSEGNNVTDQFEVASIPGTLTIEKRTLKLESASDEKMYDGNALRNEKISEGGDGFAEGEGASYSVTGSRILPGSESNSFTYALGSGTDAGNYDISTSFGTLTITNRDAKYEITVKAADAEYLYDGSEKSAEGFETLEFSVGGNSYTVEGLKAGVTQTDAGEYTSVISGTPEVKDAKGNDVSGQFAVRTQAGRLVIRPRKVTLTSGSASHIYNGRELTNKDVAVSGDGFAEGEGADYTVTGRQILAGMSDNSFSYSLKEGTKADNYEIKTVFGLLTVTSRNAKYGITLRPKNLTEMYDGTDKSVSGFETLSFMVDGNAYTVSGVEAGRTEKNAGSYVINVTGTPVVLDASGNNVTDQFEVTSVPGNLIIEKRSVVMTSADGVKPYDGTPLRNSEVTVTGDGFADGEGASYNVTGVRLLPGTEANSFTYTLGSGTDAGNYDISTSFGTLTVTNRDAKYEIRLKAADAEYLYDGTEKSAEGFETMEFTIGGNKYTVEGLTAAVSAVNAGEYTSVISGTPTVRDAAGNDVSAQFAVIPVTGRLVISPRKVTLTSGSATHAYNGRALTNDEITVSGDGFAEGEGAEYTVTGSRTTVGISDNTFTYTLNDGTEAGNYEISLIFGKLNVTNRDAKYVLTLTPNSASALYDGDEHSTEGFVSTTAVVDGESYEISGLTAGAAGTDAGTYSVSVSGTAKVTDKEGNDVTDQFSVVTNNAALTITPRHVLLRSGDESREYDGTALTGSGEVSVEGDGFVGDDGADITPTASRTLVGAVANTFDWTFRDGTKADNYIVETAYGILSITSRDAAYSVTMTANSDTVEYDGEEHSVTGFETYEFEVEGRPYTAENVDAGATGTEAGVYPTEITGAAEIKDADGNDVTDQFAVSYVNGSLTITAAPADDTPGGGSGLTPGGNGGGNGAPDNGGGSGLTPGGNGGTYGLDIDTIPDTVPATAAPAGYWALINLIMTALTVLGAVFMILRRGKDEDDEEEEEDRMAPYAAAGAWTGSEEEEEEPESRKKRLLSVIATVILAIASVVVFILTEDLTNTMALVDRYTLIMVIMFIASAVCILTGKKKVSEDDENDRRDGYTG